MNEQQLKQLLGEELYDQIHKESVEQATALKKAIIELNKAFRINKFIVGFDGDDIVKDQQTVVIKLGRK